MYKALLQLMLVHYYQVSKRSTSARATRKVDADIRALCTGNLPLHNLVDDCKKLAESAKARDRRAAQPKKPRKSASNKGYVQHVPCGKISGAPFPPNR